MQFDISIIISSSITIIIINKLFVYNKWFDEHNKQQTNSLRKFIAINRIAIYIIAINRIAMNRIAIR